MVAHVCGGLSIFLMNSTQLFVPFTDNSIACAIRQEKVSGPIDLES